jgi:hypothetical protein
MTATTPDIRHRGAEGRFARLTEQIRAVRAGSRFGRADVWMLYVGGTLMPLGVLLILLGWLGAAHTPFTFEQTPYLISGGVLGLALVIAGGFVYFGYWQTVRIRESRQQSEELAQTMARLETLLAAGSAIAINGRGGSAPAGFTFVATPNGSIFHRPDCAVVAGRNDLSAVNPDNTKLDACRICKPLDDA